MVELDRVTADAFAAHLNTDFILATDDGVELPLKLVAARVIPPSAPSTRQPFSLLFAGPPDVVLPQRIYPLSHSEMGVMEIFLVPIAANAERVEYEAIFA